MPAPRRRTPSFAGVAGVFEDSPRLPTVILRKIIKSSCFYSRGLARERGEAYAYAPLSTVRWNLGRNLSLPTLLTYDLTLPIKPFDLGFGGGGGGGAK